jgi:hypothetical protein
VYLVEIGVPICSSEARDRNEADVVGAKFGDSIFRNRSCMDFEGKYVYTNLAYKISPKIMLGLCLISLFEVSKRDKTVYLYN